MSDASDIAPEEPKCEITQFGPLTRGFKCVYLEPVALECDDPKQDGQERFEAQLRDVAAFGLGKLNYDGVFVIEPLAFVIDDGEWIVTNKQPGYCGIFLDDGTALDAEQKRDELLLNLHPYYAKRLIREGDAEAEEDGAR